MDAVKDILFELLGEGSIKNCDYSDDYATYECEDFHVDISEKNGFFLISIDLKTSFNKTSQSPIHFIYSPYEKFSKRKKSRIVSALNFLTRNKKEAGKYFGELPGYDDLGEHVRRDFYNNY
jgi:hypothetical protein